MVTRSVLTGTSLRAAERVGCFDATACDSDVVAGAIAATVGLSISGRGRSSEVSPANESTCACVRARPFVRLIAAAAAAAPRGPRALVATTHPAPFAALPLEQASAQPQRRPQHRLSAPCETRGMCGPVGCGDWGPAGRGSRGPWSPAGRGVPRGVGSRGA